METIYQKIEKAVKNANIPGIIYKSGYPTDNIVLDEELTEDETNDTMTPMLKVMEVINKVLLKSADSEDDIRVCFCHLPGEEYWGISIGDGR